MLRSTTTVFPRTRASTAATKIIFTASTQALALPRISSSHPSHLFAATRSSSSTSTSSSSSRPNQAQLNWRYLKKNYLGDSATYPLLFLLCAAGGLVAFNLIRNVTQNPAVRWNKDRRDLLEEADVAHQEILALSPPNYYAHPFRRYSENEESSRIGYVFSSKSSPPNVAPDSISDPSSSSSKQ